MAPRGRWLTGMAIAGTAAVVAAFAIMLLRQRPLQDYYGLFLFHNGPSGVVLLWMSRLVLRRRPGNGAGRVLFTIGVVSVLHVAVAVLADLRLHAAGYSLDQAVGLVPAELPLDASIPLWIMGWLWVPAPVLTITVLLLVFPDGRLRDVRWRPIVAPAAAGALLIMTAFAIDAWPSARWSGDDLPLAIPLFLLAGGLAVVVAAASSFVVLIRRWRGADVAHRQPFRIVGVAMIIFAVATIATYPWQPVWVPAVLVTFNGLLVAYGLAIARYRLHDLEPVLGRAAVATVLSGFIAAIYVTITVGAGHLLGRGIDSKVLPLVAVAIVALLIEPARRWTRRMVDRLLYGRQADRTEVLSRLASQASVAPAAEVLREVAELLVRSTGAERAEVWLDNEADAPVVTAGAAAPTVSSTMDASVTHQGERLGELRLYAHSRADLVDDAPRLLGDVAHALGLVLRNDHLATELRRQLDELRESRQRLVEAHDHARRGLERDIHDGAQARLISLRMRVGALRAQADQSADDRLAAELDAVGREVDTAVRSLRSLARGVYPPILEQSGLADAIRAHARDLSTPVTVTASGVGRYQRAVETAVYFACLEALQNAIRYSGSAQIAVDLKGDKDRLRFEVSDTGTGFARDEVPTGHGLTNIDDRISALGGHTFVDSAPGSGTRVGGEIPAQPFEAAR